jgi:hypothetical protein
LTDITEKTDFVFDQFNAALAMYISKKFAKFTIDKYTLYRLCVKEIRNKSEQLQNLYAKQQRVSEKLKEAHKKSKPTDALAEELANVEVSVADMEAELYYVKRKSLQTGLSVQFEGLKEFAQKASQKGLAFILIVFCYCRVWPTFGRSVACISIVTNTRSTPISRWDQIRKLMHRRPRHRKD